MPTITTTPIIRRASILRRRCISAAVAEAERSAHAGRDVLPQLAVGTEVSVKLSHTIDKQHYLRGFHMTSTCGVFGATAGVCNMRQHCRMDATLRAIGIAGSESSGVRENFGTMVKPLHSGAPPKTQSWRRSLAGMGLHVVADDTRRQSRLFHDGRRNVTTRTS